MNCFPVRSLRRMMISSFWKEVMTIWWTFWIFLSQPRVRREITRMRRYRLSRIRMRCTLKFNTNEWIKCVRFRSRTELMWWDTWFWTAGCGTTCTSASITEWVEILMFTTTSKIHSNYIITGWNRKIHKSALVMYQVEIQ